MLNTSTFAGFLIGLMNTSMWQLRTWSMATVWPRVLLSQTNELGIQLFTKHTLCPVFFFTVNMVHCSGVLRRKKRKFIPKPGMVY